MKKTPLQRRTPLRRTGAKADREAAALAAFRDALAARQWCQGSTPACPRGRHEGCDPHHIFPSDRDRGLHDPERGLWLCRAAHDWTHQHPTEARRRGLLHRSGDRQRCHVCAKPHHQRAGYPNITGRIWVDGRDRDCHHCDGIGFIGEDA